MGGNNMMGQQGGNIMGGMGMGGQRGGNMMGCMGMGGQQSNMKMIGGQRMGGTF